MTDGIVLRSKNYLRVSFAIVGDCSLESSVFILDDSNTMRDLLQGGYFSLVINEMISL